VSQRFEEGERLLDRQFIAADLPGETMGPQDTDDRLVHQGATVKQNCHRASAVQAADDRDHRLRESFL
jgi:hypothetical protein